MFGRDSKRRAGRWSLSDVSAPLTGTDPMRSPPWCRTSDHPTADQPDGHGDEQHPQCEQPAALDPLERPEVTGRLVVQPLRIAVLEETLRWAGRAEPSDASAGARCKRGRTELREEAERGPPCECELPALGPPLA